MLLKEAMTEAYVCYCRDGMRESNVVTKVFEVEFAPVPRSHPVDDDLGFQDEINKEQTRVSD